MTATPPRCEQGGAAAPPGLDCEACFHALLAYENERPAAFGAVHHLTVASYYLQHPRGFTESALRFWHRLLADSLSGVATPRDLLRRATRQFDGATRVRDTGATVPSWWPRGWPMTVQAVLQPDEDIDVETYVARARAWAAHTRDALDRVTPAS